jgi:hypothetical protein
MGTGDDREGFKPDDLAAVVANGLTRPEQQQAQAEPAATPTRRAHKTKDREEVVPTGRTTGHTQVETTPASDAAAPERADSPAAAAEEASFVDLVTDTPAGLKDVTPGTVVGILPDGRIVTGTATVTSTSSLRMGEPERQISSGEARTEPPQNMAHISEPGKETVVKTADGRDVTRTEPPAEPPKADDAPKPKPVKAKPEAAPKPPQPKTPEEYFEHLKTWLNRTRDPDWVTSNFGSKEEQKLRGNCGVIGEHAVKAREIRDDYLRTIS